MRVLLVNDDALVSGGAAGQMQALRGGLQKRGHDARLFASSARPASEAVAADYYCFGTLSAWPQMLLHVANPSAAWTLRKILVEFRPDVVHLREFLWQLSPLILPLLHGVPTLWHVVNYKAICPVGTKVLPNGNACRVRPGRACYSNGCVSVRAWPATMVQMALWQRWRGVVGRVVAPSEAVKTMLVAEGFGEIDVIPNVAVTKAPRPALALQPTVVCAGRLVKVKGVDFLVRAFAQVLSRVPNAQLMIAGDGPERASLEALARDLRLTNASVTITGQLSRAEMEARSSGAWAMVVPSCWEEPFPNAAAEAMMRGIAVVASRAGGLVEIVCDGESGLLVPPRDVGALVGALLRILTDRQLAETLGRGARDAALARFGEEGWVDEMINRYQWLLGN